MFVEILEGKKVKTGERGGKECTPNQKGACGTQKGVLKIKKVYP